MVFTDLISISVIYAQLILSVYSRYVNPGAIDSDEIGGLISNDRWFLLGWFLKILAKELAIMWRRS